MGDMQVGSLLQDIVSSHFHRSMFSAKSPQMRFLHITQYSLENLVKK